VIAFMVSLYVGVVRVWPLRTVRGPQSVGHYA